MTIQPAAEFSAIQAIHTALDPLDDDARARVLTYISSLLEIDLDTPKQSNTSEENSSADDHPAESDGAVAAGTAVWSFTSFAELHDAVGPQSKSEQALVAGYWLQVCQNTDSFDGQAANKELKNLGHGLANITQAINQLKSQSPALALQLKKSGTSQQARKLYKITVAGQKVIEDKIKAKAQSNG